MADIHGRAHRHAPTVTELANASRIGRARFIGNAIGGLVVVLIIGGLYMALGLAIGFRPPFYSVSTTAGGGTVIQPGAIATFVLAILYQIFFTDLAIRRRHDRNRSGVDAIVAAEIGVGNLVLALFRPGAPEGMVFGAVGIVVFVYLLVVLIFLPGTRGPNRYGEDPRELLRRAGH